MSTQTGPTGQSKPAGPTIPSQGVAQGNAAPSQGAGTPTVPSQGTPVKAGPAVLVQGGPVAAAAAKPSPPPPFTIKRVRQKERWLNMLIYGDYGVGKTRLAGSAAAVPEMNDVLFLNVEAGDLSLAEFPNILTVDINRYQQLARTFEFLTHHVRARDANDTNELLRLQERFAPGVEVLDADGNVRPLKFRTVVLDTLTEVGKYVMYQLLSVEVGKRKLDLEPDSPEFREWGQSTEMVRLLVRSLRDLPMHTIMVCSEKHEEITPGRQKAGLNMTKALAKEIPGFLDVVGYYTSGVTDAGTVERRLFLEGGRTWTAKHRFGKIGQTYLVDPEMADLIALLPKGE